MLSFCFHGDDFVFCLGDGNGDFVETSDMFVAVVAVEEDDNADGE